MTRITNLTIAAGLLEIEALLTLTRAQLLQGDEKRFVGYLLEARSKLGALSSTLLADGCAPVSELFLAAHKPERDS